MIAAPSIVTTTIRKPRDSPTLLVVDDDPEIRMLLTELFGRAGFGVEVASDGAAAILFLEHHSPPDAIVLDILMPGIIGTSVLAYLESRGTPLPAWRDNAIAMLDRARPKAALEFPFLPLMRELVFAAMEQSKLETMTPIDWRASVKALAAPPRRGRGGW